MWKRPVVAGLGVPLSLVGLAVAASVDYTLFAASGILVALMSVALRERPRQACQIMQPTGQERWRYEPGIAQGSTIDTTNDRSAREPEAQVAIEDRFQSMADAAPALIRTLDPEGRCNYLNGSWLKFTGRGRDQEMGAGWSEGIHREDRAACLNAMTQAIAQRQPLSLSYRLRRHDGEYRWIVDQAAPWRASDGTFLGYVCSGMEIHEQNELTDQRDRLLEELQARHAFTDAILRQVPAGIIVADAATGMLSLSNREAHRLINDELLSGQRPELENERIELKALRPDGTRYRINEWPLIRALREAEVIKDEEIDLVRRDGERVTLSVNAGPVKNSAGKVVAAVAALHDVTERKHAERALSQSVARFRHLADAIPQIVWILMPNNTLVYLNRRWFDYTGLSGEVSYRPGGCDAAIHPDDRGRIQEASRNTEGTNANFEAEYRIRDRDGRYHWFLGRSVKVYDDQGREICRFGTATDIDDRKRAEQAARFLADASHTLAELTDENQALRHVAKLAVPHFADWCVVDMKGPTGMPRRLAVAHVDPAKVSLAMELHHTYPPDPEATTGAVNILRTGTAEMLAELTDEMLVAGARDERHLEILRTLGLRSYMGVPIRGRTEILGVISFIRTESSQPYSEDDLRLAGDLACRAAIAVENARLCQEPRDADLRKDEYLAALARQHRDPMAPIRNSQQGEGSEFRVNSPKINEIQTCSGGETDSQLQIHEVVLNSPVPVRPKRVLLVDDNEDAARSLAMVLSIQDGYETLVAGDGFSALKLAGEFRPDLVILDIGMPGMDGYEVARRLRARPEFRHTKLVALSGWGLERDRQLSREAGIDCHLVKGGDTEIIRHVISDFLRESDSQEEGATGPTA